MKPVIQAAMVTALLFICYLLTAAPGPWYGDPSELVAAAYELGVAHPPGYSLYLLLGKVALLGGGDAYRMNLLSALFAALSVGMFHLLLIRYTRSSLVSLFAALSVGVSPLFWSLATVAEVYPLSIALLLAVPLSAELLPGRRGLFLAAYAAGTGAAHHPMGLFFLIPIALLLYTRRIRPETGRDRIGVAAFFLVPWTIHIYMMIRAGGDALVRWGETTTLEGVIRHVARLDYADLLLAKPGGEGLDLIRKLGIPWRYIHDDFRIVILSLALIGAALFWRRRKAEGLTLLVSLLFAVLFLPALLEVQNTAASIAGNRIFFLPFGFLICALAAGGLLRIGRISRWNWYPLPFFLLLALVFVRTLPEQNKRDDHGVRDLASIVLHELEPDATLRIIEGQLLFPVVYMQTVEGLRADVRIEAPRSVIHPRARGGGPTYLSSADGVPGNIALAPWGITWRLVRDNERVGWNRLWDNFTLATRSPEHMEPMEREVVFGFHLRYARALLRAGRLDRAAAEREIAGTLAGRATQGWVHMTQAYQEAGMTERAIETARRAVEHHPKNWRNHLLAGITQIEGDNLIAAEPYFREVCRLEPENGLGYLYLADLLLRLRRTEEAIEPARRGIGLYPDHPLAAPIRDALGERLR